jgi:hypothetical protein
MEDAPSLVVSKFILRPEVFGFFAYGLFEDSVFGQDFFNSEIWTRFFLDKRMIVAFLTDAQVKGWLSFQISGDISEIIPNYDSLEEWINAIE